MKAKYIFTKYGFDRNELELSDIIPETEPDYDVADVFQMNFYAEDGETASFEADNLEEALYCANRWFHSCVTLRNLQFSWECSEKIRDLAVIMDDPFLPGQMHSLFTDKQPPYVPAPRKIYQSKKKRMLKYFGNDNQQEPYSPYSLIFDYKKYYHHRHSMRR